MARQSSSPAGGPSLQGLVTEGQLDLAELEFPGILGFYLQICEQPEPPLTFLDLLARFGAFDSRSR